MYGICPDSRPDDLNGTSKRNRVGQFINDNKIRFPGSRAGRLREEAARIRRARVASVPVTSPANPVPILSGPPGTGKTTVARLLAECHGRSVHLEADCFFRFVRSGHVEPWTPESHAQNRTVMGIVGDAAAGYAADGYFTIVDGIVIPRWFLDPLCERLREAQLDVAYAILRAPLSVCTARLRARESVELAEPAVIEQLWRSFAD